MGRPSSIVNFERCYLGAFVLGLIASALGWRERMEMATIQASQSGGPVSQSLMTNMAVGMVIISAIITLLLWYFAARRRSVVAKWIIVVFFGLGLLGLLMQLAQGTLVGIGGVLTVVVYVLDAVAVWLLFRPDARAWFGETPGAHPDKLTDTFS